MDDVHHLQGHDGTNVPRSLQGSLAYSDAVNHWRSPAAYEDPTCTASAAADQFEAVCAPSQQYAPQSGGSGIDNVFPNAKWLAKLSGNVLLPLWDINVAGFVNARQGYPLPAVIRTPSRANRAGTGTADVILEPVGDVRLPSLVTADFRVDKRFTLGHLTVIPGMDVFNLTNANTVLARRRIQNSSSANQVSGIVAPRVIRFGARVTW